MRVIVSDSSVLIDVAKARLIESTLALPYVFVVPDVMLIDELLDLGIYTRNDLLDAGLQVDELDNEGVANAFGYSERYRALSGYDTFALSLAKASGCLLLTGDSMLRQAAVEQRIEVHGHLWLLDKMEKYKTVTKEILLTVLMSWQKDPLVRLPSSEIKTRISRLLLLTQRSNPVHVVYRAK